MPFGEKEKKGPDGGKDKPEKGGEGGEGVHRSRSLLERHRGGGSMGNLVHKSEEYLNEAAALYEAAMRLFGARRKDDAQGMMENAIEVLLENAKVEVDVAKILRCYFTVAAYSKRYAEILKTRETGEMDLEEMLNSSPHQANAHYTKETMDSEIFLFKTQLLMKLSSELNKTHSFKSKKYANCFTGAEAILWLLRNEIVVTREEAISLAQNMVDSCLIFHVDTDQPFQDGSFLYRFVSLELYHLQEAMRNPAYGLPSLVSALPPTPSSKKQKQKKFSGREVCDWLMKLEALSFADRADAVRLGQRLVDDYQIKDAEGHSSTFQDSEEAFYVFEREKESVLSLHNASVKGHLTLLSEGGKWKGRYFVLLPSRQQLYFFETDDSQKPKGIINLTNFTALALDDSAFSKKHCFQVVTPEARHTISCPSEESREEWTLALQHIKNELSEEKKQGSRQISSFRIFIQEAQEVATSADKNFCCVVYFGDSASGTPVARTQVQWRCKNGNPVWGEEFLLDDLPRSVNQITVSVLSKKNSLVFDQSAAAETEVGHVVIKLASLSSHVEESHHWPLTGGSGGGRLSLRFALEDELILPLDAYHELLDFACQNLDLPAAQLSLKSAQDREQFSQTVLRILESRGKALEFQLMLIKREISGISQVAVLFRQNSIATKAIVEYIKLAGESYLTDTLHAPIRAIAQAHLSLEDTSTLTPALETGLNALTECIFASASRIPLRLKRLFSEIRKLSAQQFPDDPNVEYLAVSGFLFLRWICPAIVAPVVYGILDDIADADSARVFKLLGRYIQSLANLKVNVAGEFQGDENLKAYLERNLEKMKQFLDKASEYPKDSYFASGFAFVDLERELASFYHSLVHASNEIMEKTEHLGQADKLSDIFDNLSSAYEQIWPNRSTPYQYKISLAKAARFLF